MQFIKRQWGRVDLASKEITVTVECSNCFTCHFLERHTKEQNVHTMKMMITEYQRARRGCRKVIEFW